LTVELQTRGAAAKVGMDDHAHQGSAAR
jgi:hypothetical protein